MADGKSAIAKDPSLRPVERANSVNASPIMVTATAVNVTVVPSSSSRRESDGGGKKKKAQRSNSNTRGGGGEKADNGGGEGDEPAQPIPQGYIHGYVEAVPVEEEDPEAIQRQRRRRAPRSMSVSAPSGGPSAAVLAAMNGGGGGSSSPRANNTGGISSSLTPVINESATRAYLARYRWPVGLQTALIKNLTKVPVRFFVCDDSGSMSANDGQKIVAAEDPQQQGQSRQPPAPGSAPPEQFFRFVNCTRWNELVLALEFHAGLAHAAGAPSEFRMLNSCMPVVIGDRIRDPDGLNYNYFTQEVLYSVSPSGKTPLCRHMGEIIAKITQYAPVLRANNQKAAVIIATDGESSDGDLADAMKPLQDLPVWVVVRLCTDNIRVVKYWNHIDESLEIDMDVLDDIFGEAKEIKSVNPWFTYAEPIHRLREFGIAIKEIDLLDERKLSLDQIRNFAAIM